MNVSCRRKEVVNYLVKSERDEMYLSMIDTFVRIHLLIVFISILILKKHLSIWRFNYIIQRHDIDS